MGAGSPGVFIKEYNLAATITSYKGAVGAIVIDSEKGPVNQKVLSTSINQLLSTHGRISPRQWGTSIYSATNFLLESNKLWVARVDKGQTYSTALVRAVVDPIVEFDEYGYPLENPIVDPIVKPLGPMTMDQINNYQFAKYPHARVVEQFNPPVALIDKPSNGDIVFNIDNSAPINIGDVIAFKDTNGMTREQTMQYLTYTVTEKEAVLTPFDYIKIDENINAVAYDSTIKAVKYYYMNTAPASYVNRQAVAGDSVLYSRSLNASISQGSVIAFDSMGQSQYTVANVSDTTFLEDFTNPVVINSVEGSKVLSTINGIAEISPGNIVSVDGNSYSVVAVNQVTSPKTVTLNAPIVSKWITNSSKANVSGVAAKFSIFVALEANSTFTVTIDNNTYSFTTTSTSTVSDIINTLTNNINAANIAVTATADVASIKLVAKNFLAHVVTASSNMSVLSEVRYVIPVAQKIDLTPILQANTNYILSVNGVDYTVTSDATTTVAQICTQFATQLQSDLAVSTTVSATSIVLESKAAGVPYTFALKTVATLKNVVAYKAVSLSSYLTTGISSGTSIKIRSMQVADYIPICTAKEVVPGTTNTIRVSSNDQIAEGDYIQINSIQYRVNSKWQVHNLVNRITVDTEFANQSSVVIGSPVLHVTSSDFVQHDAMLIYAKTPGAHGNRLAYAIRDSKDYAEAFWIDAYNDGNLVESWEVARQHMQDGYGRQLFVEDKVNVGSSWFGVKNNEFMTDENGKLLEPLKTTFYIRQPIKTPIYTQNASILETVWDGDNRIRINPEKSWNIDVTKPVMIGNNIYPIASLGSSIVGGPMDTIVLQTGVSLGLTNLPPLDQHLEINAPVSQYFDRAEIQSISVITAEASSYSIKVTGATFVNYLAIYTFNSATTEISSILQGLANEINADVESRITATVTGSELHLQSKVAGVDILLETSPNLLATVIQSNARAYTNYNLQKINQAIMPQVTIGSVVDILGSSYVIRDAGANRSTGGDDIGFPTVGQFINTLDTVFSDPENADFIVIMDGGITAKAYQQRLVEICEKRMDCFAVLSTSFEAMANPDLNLGVLKFRSELMINSSYAALYTPWTQIYDSKNDFKIWISPESWAARAISYVSTNKELWYAAAGWENGRVVALDVYRRYTSGERDILYDNQINPIRFAPNKGLVIWGQKTLQVTPGPTDRVNVRFLLIVIERGLRDYLESQVFQFNDEVTRGQISSAANRFLRDIKIKRGLYDFEIVCDKSNNSDELIDSNGMYVDAYLQATKTAEYITSRIALTPTGAKFSELRL